jgi:hypothetical protein
MPILTKSSRGEFEVRRKKTVDRQIGGGSKIEATPVRRKMSKETYKATFRRTHYEVSRLTTQKGQIVGINDCRSVKKC